jgi:16S rRNA (cytidine1402-2'-O)-methyltransferase
MAGMLILVPTPIDETNELHPKALLMINDSLEKGNSLFAIEDLKPGRRRWIKWGLPREEIENFILYNEHTREKACVELIQKLKSGKNIFLMSDGGLPAFCDPGKELVAKCHDHNIKVTSTPFCNSVLLALALSGFNHEEFYFAGFLPAKKEERAKKLNKIIQNPSTFILMDTPYRMAKTVTELGNALKNQRGNRRVLLAMDLNSEDEEIRRGTCQQVLKGLEKKKSEFILIVDSLSN